MEPNVPNGSANAPTQTASATTPDTTTILEVSGDNSRGDVSASTIGRMLGLATVGELKLIESKIDLLASKVNLITVRVEKIITAMATFPTGKDLERIDVQIGALRTMIRDILPADAEGKSDKTSKSKEGAGAGDSKTA